MAESENSRDSLSFRTYGSLAIIPIRGHLLRRYWNGHLIELPPLRGAAESPYFFGFIPSVITCVTKAGRSKNFLIQSLSLNLPILMLM